MYQYWVIRYVPNLARGEFVNVGIVCGRDGGDWAVATEMANVRHLGGTVRLQRELEIWTKWFQSRAENYSSVELDGPGELISAGWMKHLQTRQENTIQISDGVPIFVESAKDAISILMPQLVLRGEGARENTTGRLAIRKALQEKLISQGNYVMDVNLFMRRKIVSGRQTGSVDILRLEKDRPVLTQTWSFNVKSIETLEREIQSWNYLVTRLRDDGGVTRTNNEKFSVAPNIEMSVVYDPPMDSQNLDRARRVLDAAQEAWRLNDVAFTEMSNFSFQPV